MNTKRLVILAGLALGLPAMAQASSTGSITIYGTVPLTCSIAVTQLGATAGSPLDLTNNYTDQAIATVAETCNRHAGYVVTVETANGSASGRLVGGVSSDSLSYSLKYNGSNVGFSGGIATVTDANAKANNVVRNVTLSLTGDGTLAADTYTDSLTFTITAK